MSKVCIWDIWRKASVLEKILLALDVLQLGPTLLLLPSGNKEEEVAEVAEVEVTGMEEEVAEVVEVVEVEVTGVEEEVKE
jgi:hypothetical protein